MHDLARPKEDVLVVGPFAVAAARSRSDWSSPEEPQAADAQHLTAVVAVAETHAGSEQMEHGGLTAKGSKGMRNSC
jgi:hypothetical protein